jgi:OOP family OmpA-OmpF porin
MKKLSLSVAASTLALSFSAVAQDQLPTEAFLGAPSNGRVVMDTYGNCVRTMQWSPDKEIVGCGKKPAPVALAAPPAPRTPPVLVPAPPPAPVVAAPPPPPPVAAPIAPVAVAPAAAPKTKPMRNVTIGGDAFFDVNKASFRKEAQPELDKFAEQVRRVSAVDAVQITGHTDSTGATDYNQKLSEQRAATVKDFLVKNGVDPSKITILGMGERQPLADNGTKEGRAKNRRVEVMVKGMVQEP